MAERSSDGDVQSGVSLVRLAVVTIHKTIENPSTWTLPHFADVEVGMLESGGIDDRTKMLLFAQVPMRYFPKVTADNLVVVPEQYRKKAEDVLTDVANLISVAEACRRELTTPVPVVAFKASTPAAEEWLLAKSGIDVPGEALALPTPLFGFDLDASTTAALADRLDGIALLAESLATRHASGRFHEFMRVFERAFALPAARLTDPLCAFLDQRFDYSPIEIDGWIQLRDPLSHADVRPSFVTEVDLDLLINRVEQAAFDVVLNKAEWRTRSSERRQVWEPRTIVADRSGAVLTVTSSAIGQSLVGAAPIDAFSTFRLDEAAGFLNRPASWWPAGWWPWSYRSTA